MLYPDEVLQDIGSDFTDAHWHLLALLGCDYDEASKLTIDHLLSFEETKVLSPDEMFKSTSLSQNFFRSNLKYLEGAHVIQTIPDRNDSRKREIKLTENGYRVLQAKLAGQFIATP